nr:hypothetical protein [Oxalobacteraceae bacterium]
MKWFDRWFARKCEWAWNQRRDSEWTFHRYDRKRDENHNRTYIITDDQDFERELGKIITLEAMRS